LGIQVNWGSGIPIYLQIADRIKHMVATGEFPPGQQLPAIRQLALGLHIDPNTVARAYRMLDEEGVISTQQGRGTFIAEHPRLAELSRLRQERLRALIGEALLEAFSRGHSPDEIQAAFKEELAAWK
jgi:GntR family transcriptional regulator